MQPIVDHAAQKGGGGKLGWIRAGGTALRYHD